MPSPRPTLLPAALVAGLPLPSLAEETFKVITSFTVIADMARNVAGQEVEVVSVTKPGAEIHGYEPTPQDSVGASDADLLLWNGLGLERWFEQFLSNLGDTPSATLTDGIAPMSITGSDYDGKPNPHAWMSIENALIHVDNIEAAPLPPPAPRSIRRSRVSVLPIFVTARSVNFPAARKSAPFSLGRWPGKAGSSYWTNPFTGVDVKTEEQIIMLLRALRDEGQVTLVSTHNLGSVPEFCDRTVLVKGTVIARGPTENIFTRDNLERAFGGVLRHFTLGGTDLHEDDDTREIRIITDDERPFGQYGRKGDK